LETFYYLLVFKTTESLEDTEKNSTLHNANLGNILFYKTMDLTSNTAFGGASSGVWGRNPSAVIVEGFSIKI